MQQFLVPQFIDVEDKIIGPVTTRQFVELLVAVPPIFLLYKFAPFVYFVVFGLMILVIAIVLAFVKINGRPVHFFMLNFLQTLKRPMVRVWNREAYVRQMREVKSEIKEVKKVLSLEKKPVTGSRLHDIALVVNTGGVFDNLEEDDNLK